MTTKINDEMFAPEVIADPYTYYGQLREEDPIHWNEKFRQWVVTRHDDVIWFTRHHELFSSAVSKNDNREPYPPIPEEDIDLFMFTRHYNADMFIQHDRPEHIDMRRVIHGSFTPRAMEAWRPLVQTAIAQLLDDAEEKGEMDVMQDLATPLPLLVIAQLMGVPQEDRLLIRDLSRKFLHGGQGGSNRMKVAAEGTKEFAEYLSPLVAERIANPKEDLLSVLCEGERRGVYNRENVVSNATLLLIAGHETTINLICNGTLAFINHPDQWELLKEDPMSRTVKATEECLRYDSPVKTIQRIASEDVEVRGKNISEGEVIRWVISSANRDPEMFDEPDKLDIDRYPNRHVAFGSGIHHCLGSTIARMEGQEVFKALAERFDNLHLKNDELEYLSTIGFRSLISLPVTWD